MSSSPAGHVRGPGTGCKTGTGAREEGSWGVTFLGGAYVDQRELDRFAFEAGHDYDFRLAALVRQLREHRTMLMRYVTAHAAAAQAGIRQLPAATQALLEAYNDARELLGEPSPKTVAESSKRGVTVPRLAANGAASSVSSRSRS
jgi:hypothetical protein